MRRALGSGSSTAQRGRRKGGYEPNVNSTECYLPVEAGGQKFKVIFYFLVNSGLALDI